MTDATGAEYELSPPTGDWLADLIAVGEQARAVLRRHRWLAGLSVTRPVIGPNGLALMEHVLEMLRPHPAGAAAKMEAFAMLNGVTAAFALQELAEPGPAGAQRRLPAARHRLGRSARASPGAHHAGRANRRGHESRRTATQT